MSNKNQDKSHQYHRLMGCTVDDLIGWMPAASNYKEFTVKKEVSEIKVSATIDFPMDGIQITANNQDSRRIALLVIPVLAVVFSFSEKWDKLACEKFMKRFDMYTQRGGG